MSGYGCDSPTDVSVWLYYKQRQTDGEGKRYQPTNAWNNTQGVLCGNSGKSSIYYEQTY